MFLAFAICLFGQLTFPPQIKGDVGQFIPIQPTVCAGLEVQYFALDAVSVFPASLLSDKKATVVVATRPGKYRLVAWTAVDGKPTPGVVITVEVGGGTVIPVPPEPQPKPPQPDINPDSDPLYLDLQSILGGLQEPEQKRNLALLASVFDRSSRITGVQTVGQLYAEMRKLSAATLRPDVLEAVRGRVGAEVKAGIGDLADGPVDPAKYGPLFSRIGAVLNKLALEVK